MEGTTALPEIGPELLLAVRALHADTISMGRVASLPPRPCSPGCVYLGGSMLVSAAVLLLLHSLHLIP